MPISLYNSLTRRTEPFAPLDPARVTMYLCGPTVYNYVHIGNARGPVVFDVLARLLRRHYPQVVYARNITDVEDKINAAAQAEGVPITTITERYARAYHEDMAGLGIAPPDVEPYATAHIGAIVAMNETLIAKGHAYAAEGHVLFDVASYPEYGALSGRDTEELIAGARVEIAPYKKNPTDFVLWKPSTPELAGWDSPWGRGRPGWHIECSAMCAAQLGETIDIHAGGNDLLFPHHENEIRPVHLRPRRQDLRALVDAQRHAHLRRPQDVQVAGQCAAGARAAEAASARSAAPAPAQRPLPPAAGLVRRRHPAIGQHAGRLVPGAARPRRRGDRRSATARAVRRRGSLCDDLNTPQALAELALLADAARQHGTPAAKADLLGGGALLGLLQQDPETWFKRVGGTTVNAAQVEALLDERRAARGARDFARADAIRDELTAMGVVIEDGAQGTRWSIAKA
ncbi:Cysteine--tRNA ligase [Rhodanobacter lindaniclasticus]